MRPLLALPLLALLSTAAGAFEPNIPFDLLPLVKDDAILNLPACFAAIAVPATVTEGQELFPALSSAVGDGLCKVRAWRVTNWKGEPQRGFRFQGEYRGVAQDPPRSWTFVFPERMVVIDENRSLFVSEHGPGFDAQWTSTSFMSAPLVLNGRVVTRAGDEPGAIETEYRQSADGTLRRVNAPSGYKVNEALDSVSAVRDAMAQAIADVDRRYLAAQPQPSR